MTDRPTFFEQLKDRIASGDERGALNELRPFTKERAPRFYNETLLQLARLNQIDHSDRLGDISREDIRVEHARIRKALLQLVDRLATSVHADLLPPPRAAVDFVRSPDETSLEAIIGASNLKSIAWLRRGLEVARSVCRVVTPFSVGSGFIIAGGRLLTNHHVISSTETAARSYVEFNVEEDLAGHLTTPYRVAIEAASVIAEPDLDYCLAALVEPAGGMTLSEWGTLDLETTAVPAVGEHVTIIQHPVGGPKQIAITANQVVNVFGHRLQYSTDTMPGSSGSPVFNDAWKVVAVHHAGGNVVSNARGARMFANEGILMRELAQRLRL